MRPTRSMNNNKAIPRIQTLAANLMAKIWNAANDLQNVATLEVAKPASQEMGSQPLWFMMSSDVFPHGNEKETHLTYNCNFSLLQWPTLHLFNQKQNENIQTVQQPQKTQLSFSKTSHSTFTYLIRNHYCKKSTLILTAYHKTKLWKMYLSHCGFSSWPNSKLE